MEVQTISIADHIVMSTDRHEHDYYQLMYCQGGRGNIEIGGTSYPVVAGNA